MAGTLDDALGLSEKQRAVFEKFKENVKDSSHPDLDDHSLVRWVKARSFDLKKSEEMFRANLRWREKYKIDNIVEEYEAPEVLRAYFPGGPGGLDKEGCPVWVTPSGGLDMKGITLSVSRFEIIMYNMNKIEQTCKRLKEVEEKAGKHIGQVVIIDDFKGFTMKKLFQPGMDLLLKILAIVEANYPEMLKACYIINAPIWWSMVFNIIKPFLSEATKSKIVILGSDWKEKISKEIDPDQLPEAWGGTISGSGEVCMGGDVPSSYFLSEQTLIDPDKWTHVVVAAGTKIDLQFKVTEPKSVLKYLRCMRQGAPPRYIKHDTRGRRWLFKTEEHDIAFGVTYVIDITTNSLPSSPNNEDDQDLIKRSVSGGLATGEGNPRVAIKQITRLNCHQIPEDGFLVCDQVGTYIVYFCNSHSWMTSKKLQYYIQVISPTANVTDSSVRSDLMGEK